MMDNFVKERDEAFIEAIVNDNWRPAQMYCFRYGVPIPNNEKVFKAGIYKAVQECTNISNEVKDLAMQKCLELGFYPFIYDGKRK